MRSSLHSVKPSATAPSFFWFSFFLFVSSVLDSPVALDKTNPPKPTHHKISRFDIRERARKSSPSPSKRSLDPAPFFPQLNFLGSDLFSRNVFLPVVPSPCPRSVSVVSISGWEHLLGFPFLALSQALFSCSLFARN